MRKKISLLCLFVLGLLMLPKLVLAEDLPREGVHYFLTYPDGSEVVTKSYEEATSQEEKLIYSGLTSSEGQVVLEGLLDEGSLRIVQKVPNGYTTDTTEVSLDLSQGKSPVEFVDYKGVNPKTGQSILFIVGIAAVLLISFVVVKKDSKKLFIIPVLLVGGLFLQVKAANEDLVITVKDKEGKTLAGVEVEVYAKPVRVEAAPAVIFDANGGKFFDGKEIMYFRLPSSPCTDDQFDEFLTDDQYNYLWNNFYNAYREGYYFSSQEYLPDELTNDTVVKILWEEDEDVSYFTVHGNGGVLDFYGNKLTTYKLENYYDNFADYISMLSYFRFINNDLIITGYSNSASCDTLLNGDSAIGSDIYVCWGPKVDGIYVNGMLFAGNIENCYSASHPNFDYRYFELVNDMNAHFAVYDDNGLVLSMFTLRDGSNDYAPHSNPNLMNDVTIIPGVSVSRVLYEIDSIEIVKDKRVVLSLSSDDLTNSYSSNLISNTEKASQFMEFFNNFGTSCGNPDFSDDDGPTNY